MKRTITYLSCLAVVCASFGLARADYYVRKRTQYGSPGTYTTVAGPCVNEPNCPDGCYISIITTCTAGYLGGDGKTVHLWSQIKTVNGWQQDQSVWYTNVSSPVYVHASVNYPNSTNLAVRAVVQVYENGGSTIIGQNWLMYEDCP